MSFEKAVPGNTNPEWATVIFEVFGIKEKWTRIEKFPFWKSSHEKKRKELEKIVGEIKQRTANNIFAVQRMVRAVNFIKELFSGN